MSDDIRVNRSGADWQAIKALLTDEIATLQRSLETPFIGEGQTENLRGGIALARRIISKVEPEYMDTSGQPLDYSVVQAPQRD